MKPFRNFMGDFPTIQLENLDRTRQQQVQKLYDTATRLLLGAAKDQLHVPLSDIEDDTGSDGKPPTNKGPRVALEKLSNAQIFQKLQSLGDPKLTAQANNAQNWLQKIASDQTVGPKDTVGGLLDKMFGQDSASDYGRHAWKTTPKTPTQQPVNAQSPGDPSVAPPMAQQMTPMAPAAPAPAPMPMGGEQPPMPAPAMPPMPDPNQPVDPNNPATPPTTPNGPMPPKPPGGLQMA